MSPSKLELRMNLAEFVHFMIVNTLPQYYFIQYVSRFIKNTSAFVYLLFKTTSKKAYFFGLKKDDKRLLWQVEYTIFLTFFYKKSDSSL